jgi:hypothetical protein
MTAPWTVAFYALGRAYGGGEEGGWWFDTGEFIRVAKRAFDTEDAACIYSSRVNKMLRHLQRNTRDQYSMAYDGGRVGASVYDETPPMFYPAQRPTYE